MRNDVFFIVATTLLAGVVTVLILWLDSQQTYLLAHLGATSESERVEAGFEPEQMGINPQIDYRIAERSSAGINTIDDVSRLARELNSPDSTAERDIEILHTLVDVYRSANEGRIPQGGLNEEIVDALRGRNSRHLAVLPDDLPAISNAGELRDRWGTAYFLHPLSSSKLEIISAGPDRKLRTADDIGNEDIETAESGSLALRRR